VVVDYDAVGVRVVDRHQVEVPDGTIVGGRVVDPHTLARRLAGVVGAVEGQVVTAWRPDDGAVEHD
jgi:hypothetical protein